MHELSRARQILNEGSFARDALKQVADDANKRRRESASYESAHVKAFAALCWAMTSEQGVAELRRMADEHMQKGLEAEARSLRDQADAIEEELS